MKFRILNIALALIWLSMLAHVTFSYAQLTQDINHTNLKLVNTDTTKTQISESNDYDSSYIVSYLEEVSFRHAAAPILATSFLSKKQSDLRQFIRAPPTL